MVHPDFVTEWNRRATEIRDAALIEALEIEQLYWRFRMPRKYMTRVIPMDSLFLGHQIGLPLQAWSRHLPKGRAWNAVPMAKSPHVLFLKFIERPYLELAQDIIGMVGKFHGDRTVDDVRGTADRWRTDVLLAEDCTLRTPIVAPIRGTQAYEVVDGHHLIAEQIMCCDMMITCLVTDGYTVNHDISEGPRTELRFPPNDRDQL